MTSRVAIGVEVAEEDVRVQGGEVGSGELLWVHFHRV